ncbi:MAG: TonB-dependent receptor [Burkholderiales bacterium]|nr:TonB-dependent receptor [Burkholderiales bacterium]
MPLVPRHKANATVSWQMNERMLFAATIRYVGEQRYDNDQANTFDRKIPAYTLVDLVVSRSVGAWRFRTSLLNAFGEKYYTYGIATSA